MRQLLFFIVCAAWLVGCGRSSQAPAIDAAARGSNATATANSDTNANSTIQTAPTNNLRSFSTRGVIREVPAGGKTLLVRHEEIPGFMPPMTMEFDVRNTNELAGLKTGDTITFNVMATDEDSWIEGIQRAGTNAAPRIQQQGPSAASLLHAAQLKPGDELPDAELLTEDGRSIKISSFEGKVLAFTFIFTRCPLPNFCPRMNQNFYRARDLLLEDKGNTNWQFLSISFDPDFDKPGVLSRYAYSYRGENSNGWVFASAPTNVMSSMSPLLDFRFANEGGSFQHNLRTVVLDPKRRVYKQFEGNSWKAAELAQAMKEASSAVKMAEAAAKHVKP